MFFKLNDLVIDNNATIAEAYCFPSFLRNLFKSFFFDKIIKNNNSVYKPYAIQLLKLKKIKFPYFLGFLTSGLIYIHFLTFGNLLKSDIYAHVIFICA